MLTPADVYEIEMASYQSLMKTYEETPQHLKDLGLIAIPEKPTLRLPDSNWNMRGVVTGSRRKWRG